MKTLVNYICEKSLEDELAQLGRIRKQIDEWIKDVKKNPDNHQNLINSNGTLNYSFIGQRFTLPLKLLAKICQRHNIGAYIVKYKGNDIYFDYLKNKPFYFKNGKKAWLKKDAMVSYLDDKHLTPLDYFEVMDLEKYL